MEAAVGPVAATYTVNDFYFTHDGKLIVRFSDFMAGKLSFAGVAGLNAELY